MPESSSNSTVDSERLELALRASNEGIWDWHLHEESIYYSRRILEFLECSSSQAPNFFLKPHKHVHPLDRTEFADAVSQSLDQNGPETLAVDARVQTGSNEWRWLRIRGTVVRDRKGTATRIAGSMIDISLRKAAEAQIEEERHLLRTLIDHVPLQIYFKDLQSRIILANRGMADWHGLASNEDLIGKHDKDLFSAAHWQKAEADEKRIIETGTPISGQLETETWHESDDSYVVTSKFPWRDRNGVVKGTFGVSSDVTSLVLAQRQATELANELQQKNASYEEELQLAREIQQALSAEEMPPVTLPNGYKLTFGSRYLPISGLAGDFYEVIPYSNGTYGIFICDVMGHGIRAALIVSMLRGLIATQDCSSADAAEFLTDLNMGLSSILERAGVTMFATAFYGIIDPSNLTLSYACAGHPGPVLSGKQKSFQLATEKDQRGPALGLITHSIYFNQIQSLADIHRILLFTDGVLEAENKTGEQFLDKRLLNVCGDNPSANMSEWLDGIIRAVLDFSGHNHFDDDVCLLGIEISNETNTPPKLTP